MHHSPPHAAGPPRPSGTFPFVFAALVTLGIALSLYLIFVVAPVERQMGIVQKIFYFHVPSAYAMYVGFAVSAVASGMFLWKRSAKWDAWAVSGAEVGLLFCIIVLSTGPLWARKAWGVWWTWDPRLSTTLAAGLVYVGALALRALGDGGVTEKRFAAGVAVFGFLDLPLIHYSVQRWRGQHPTVITAKGGGLDPDMRVALTVSFLAFTVLVIWLLLVRARLAEQRSRIEALQLDALELGNASMEATAPRTLLEPHRPLQPHKPLQPHRPLQPGKPLKPSDEDQP